METNLVKLMFLFIAASGAARAIAQELVSTRVKLPGAAADTRANFVTELQDGKLLVHAFAGAGERYFLRLNPDLSLDTTYAEHGFRPLGYNEGVLGTRGADSVIVYSRKGDPSEPLKLYKYDLHGVADESFGDSGVRALLSVEFASKGGFRDAPGSASPVAVEPRTGALVLAGFTDDYLKAVAIRLTPSGAVDRTFGEDGVLVLHDFGAAGDFKVPRDLSWSVATPAFHLSDGRLALCIAHQNQFRLFLLARDGRTAREFASAATARLSGDGNPTLAAISYDGRDSIYLANTIGSVLKVQVSTARVDASFGDNGVSDNQLEWGGNLVARKGGIYVDQMHAIVKLGSDGRRAMDFGKCGQFPYPKSVSGYANWTFEPMRDGSIAQTWGILRDSTADRRGTILVSKLMNVGTLSQLRFQHRSPPRCSNPLSLNRKIPPPPKARRIHEVAL